MSQNYIAELKHAIRNLRLELETFEKKYNRTSADFYDVVSLSPPFSQSSKGIAKSPTHAPDLAIRPEHLAM